MRKYSKLFQVQSKKQYKSRMFKSNSTNTTDSNKYKANYKQSKYQLPGLFCDNQELLNRPINDYCSMAAMIAASIGSVLGEKKFINCPFSSITYF